jgi:hypothetical protein
MKTALLWAVSSLAVGCFAPAIEDGALFCPDQLCPTDFQCAKDGRCYRGPRDDFSPALDSAAFDATDACAPITCATTGGQCGLLSDRCGGTIQCDICREEDHCDSKHHCVH